MFKKNIVSTCASIILTKKKQKQKQKERKKVQGFTDT